LGSIPNATIFWFLISIERGFSMRAVKVGALRDQFGALVEVGKVYGVRLKSDPATRAVAAECDFIIRGRYWFRTRDGLRFDVPMLSTPQYVATLLDDQLREVTATPPAVIEQRVAEFRDAVTLISAQARATRSKQARLMERVFRAWGCVDPGERLAEAVATFVRDEESHVTIETLTAAYRDALLGEV
jgi:hypothetical protein